MLSPDSNALTIIGETDHHGRQRRFGIRQRDRLMHMWIVGKSGQGKSTLLTNLIYRDLVAGRGVALIDPHGDLAEAVLDLVPEARIGDTIYFDPSDAAFPIAFNPLDPRDRLEPHLVASGVIAGLKKTWPTFWGPRMEYILRCTLLTLLEMPGSTLLDLHRLLIDAPFRKRITARLQDRQLVQFWQQEFASYGGAFKTEVVAPILNKTGQYLTTRIIRNIVGQNASAFSFRDVIDSGGVFLANLARGRLGEDLSGLLGSLLVNQIELAALNRVDVGEEDRRDFFLYIDEAQIVLTQAMVDLLPEARKFHLGLVLAHQYLDQLDEPLRYSVLGNVGTLISFRVGARDTTVLSKELAPDIGMVDLMSLPAYNVYVKLAVDGTTTPPFSARTLPAPKAVVSHRDRIIAETRRRYARPVAEVEQEMGHHWRPAPGSSAN